jgi:hypothetical protein
VAISNIRRRRRCKTKGARAKLLEEATATGTSATILALLQLLPDYLNRPPAEAPPPDDGRPDH